MFTIFPWRFNVTMTSPSDVPIFSLFNALLTLHGVTEMHFLLQKNLKNIMHGRVKMYVMR